MMEKPTVKECVQALQSDRLITLIIGNSQAAMSVQVQQSVLEAVSPWFQKALRDQVFVEGQTGKILFPEDDPASWEIFLYWLLRREIPRPGIATSHEEDLISLAKCWILGDKYGITKFQDEVMLFYLHIVDLHCVELAPEQCKELTKITPPGSKLMKLLSEESARFCEQNGLTSDGIATLDGVPGFWPTFVEAQQKMKKHSDQFTSRMKGVGSTTCDEAHWSDYMAGDLPDFAEFIEDRG
ncbi:hypothetical protein CB0940_07146 [Cercospora beticola]|uniref:BTB domain-containing protein n=2 Tax=Cercospora beticola TaxID=122368 RepID=A0A2G5HAV5_CERBT|nr:hypothetical protein CB0940_07146 [Cercospora beticola]PIA89413.1 hypothetical protein CB0940_07146 [Cercospora beticola]